MSCAAISVAVLTGGASRRFGRDKALAPLGARPMLARVLERLGPLTDDLFLVGGEPERYRFLALPVQADLRPGMGALSRLHAALTHSRHETVLIVACDMPLVSPALAVHLARQPGPFDAVVPCSARGLEPLHALYRRPCLAAATAMLDAGGGGLRALLTRVRHCVIPAETVSRLCGGEDPFANVNTPEEHARMARDLSREGR